MVQQSMRPTCLACLRPQSACICQLISIVHSDIEVLILQHPLEVLETKGTARLLHLCLPNSSMLTGEVFEESLLLSTKNTLLLYPTTPEDHSLGIATPPESNQFWLNNSQKNLQNIRLIIIDGTWRKSRKILCKNQYLQTMPRLVLDDLPAGQYTIRKAPKPYQLSTLEATTAALMQLENDAVKFAPLEQSFLAFNAMLSKKMGR